MRYSAARWAADVSDYRKKRASYWTPDGRMSPGLLRAREPFRVRNALTGGIILAFVTGVYFYSISAVKQDDFSDVPLPSPEEMKRIQAELDAEAAEAADKGPREVVPGPGRTGGGAARGGGAVQGTDPLTTPEGAQLPAMGILGSVAFLSGRAGPATSEAGVGVPPVKTGLVEGAPPLDRLGSTREKTTLGGERRLV